MPVVIPYLDSVYPMAYIDIETTIPAELQGDLELAKEYVNFFAWKHFDIEEGVQWEKLHRKKPLSETELKAATCLLKGFSKKDIKKRIVNLEEHALIKKVESFRKTIDRVKKYLEFIAVYKSPLVSPCIQIREEAPSRFDSDRILEYLKSKQYSFLQVCQDNLEIETRLYGRAPLISSLVERISKQHSQILVLQGPLGIGKKSLSRAISYTIQNQQSALFYSIDFEGFSHANGAESYQYFINKLGKLTSTPAELSRSLDATTTSLELNSFLLKEKNAVIEELKSNDYIIVLDDFKAFEAESGDPFYVFFSDFLKEASSSLFIINSAVSIPFVQDLAEKSPDAILQSRVQGISYEAATEMLTDSGIKREAGINKIIDTYSGSPGELRIIAKVINNYFESSPDLFVEHIIDGGSVFLSELNGYEKILDLCSDTAIAILQRLIQEGVTTFSFLSLLSLFGASVNKEFKELRDLSLIDELEDAIGQYRINPVVRRSLEKHFNQPK